MSYNSNQSSAVTQ